MQSIALILHVRNNQTARIGCVDRWMKVKSAALGTGRGLGQIVRGLPRVRGSGLVTGRYLIELRRRWLKQMLD